MGRWDEGGAAHARQDQGIKRLLQSHPRDLLALALPDAEYLGPVPVDVATEPQLVMDTLLRVRYHGEECLVDIEAEARPRPDIGRRCYEYGSRASIIHQLSVLSFVLWLERDGAPPASPYTMGVAELQVATWNFFGIEVYALPAERVLSGDLARLPALLALVPFMSGGNAVPALERAVRLAQDRATSREELGELATLLAVFAARDLGVDGALALVRRTLMSTEILETSPLYRRWVDDTMREAARVALLGRWGELPEDVAAAVEAASRETLLDVIAHVAADTAEELRARLGM